MGQRIGYIRVSALDRKTDRQLVGTTVDRLFADRASGKDAERPQLESLLGFVHEGDVVVVHSMDRLARTSMTNQSTSPSWKPRRRCCRSQTIEWMFEEVKKRRKKMSTAFRDEGSCLLLIFADVRRMRLQNVFMPR